MEIKNNTQAQYLPGLESIFPQYDAFIIDLWGVVHDGINPYPGTVDCLNRMIESGKSVTFMSNTPRPWNTVYQRLKDFKVNLEPEMILTSGDLVRSYLQEKTTIPGIVHKKYYHLGAHRNADILHEIQVELVDNIEEADKLLLTLYMDEGEDVTQYDAIFEKALARKLPLVCANPDKIVVNGPYNRYCAGFFAERYESKGGKVIYYGKPHPAIYEVALKKISEQGIQDLKRILMIGDTMDTDVAGAMGAGIGSALVLSGNASTLLKDNIKPHHTEALLKDYHYSPNWILDSLKW